MKKEDPLPNAADEIRELIRVKVDLAGLRQEDIEWLIEHAKIVKRQ